MIIAGDIGGTNCRLAACEDDGHPVAQQIYPSQSYHRFADIVLDFMARTGHHFRAGCFGLAGPVVRQRCQLTNIDWDVVDAADLSAETGIERIELLNDVETTAYGIATLTASEVLTLNPGEPVSGGNVAIVTAGSDIGEAALIFGGDESVVIASEGGSADFGPIDDAEIELLKYIQRTFRCVSYEMVVSGFGLECMYYLHRDRSGRATPQWLAERLASGDRPAAISEVALSGRDEACVRALEMYVSILAAETANVALKFLALGGVYIGGGVPPKIRQMLVEPLFMDRFTCKDKMSGLLRRIPVHVILDDNVGLQGAAARAVRLARVSTLS